jgi:hypothetical protein
MSRSSSRGSSSTTSPPPCVRVPRHVAQLVTRLVVDYFDYAARPGASACRAARHAARRAARCRLLRLRLAFRCLGTSRGSSSTTSTTPRVQLLRHIAQLVALLVVDYFASAARPVASARRAARHRLLRLRHASRCLGMSRGSSSTTSPLSRVRVPRHVAQLVTRLVVDYFASRRLVVDYFTYATHPGASAPRAARRAARRRLLHLRRTSGCLSTSRDSSRGLSSTTSPRAGSSSTTSPTPRVRVPRHLAQLVTPLVVNYFAYATRPGASARHTARHAACHRLLRLARARR